MAGLQILGTMGHDAINFSLLLPQPPNGGGGGGALALLLLHIISAAAVRMCEMFWGL